MSTPIAMTALKGPEGMATMVGAEAEGAGVEERDMVLPNVRPPRRSVAEAPA